MLKRTVSISGPDTALMVHYGQIEVSRNGERIGSFPAEDVGVLIADTPTARYTHGTLLELLRQNAAVVFCDEKHLPAGMLLPVEANSVQAQRLRAQAATKQPVLKRLWQQIIRAKIHRQAALLQELDHLEYAFLRELARKVRSGDPHNVEAQAARFYWPALFGKEFRREREGSPPNGLLNYGYMVVRAAVARALCGAGLHPSLGLHHSNKYNAFALADDLLEPLRPLVDRTVQRLVAGGQVEIDAKTKPVLLGLLAGETALSGPGSGPLLVAIERYASSLAGVFCGEGKGLEIPDVFAPAGRSTGVPPVPSGFEMPDVVAPEGGNIEKPGATPPVANEVDSVSPERAE